MKFNGLAELPPPVAYMPSVGLGGFAQSYRINGDIKIC